MHMCQADVECFLDAMGRVSHEWSYRLTVTEQCVVITPPPGLAACALGFRQATSRGHRAPDAA